MGDEAPRAEGPATALAVLFAMTFPSLLTWVYFVALGGGDRVNPVQQVAYLAGKALQFGFPLAFLWLGEGQRWRLRKPRFDGLLLGLGFGLLVAGAMVGLYLAFYRTSATFAPAAVLVRRKLGEFGLTSPAGYALLATFIVVIHSLLEEYYWRWFVFGRLRRLLPLLPAILLSSLAFMAHHVIVLHYYFPGQFVSAVLPFSLGVAVGGAAWAYLYERTGTIYSPWLSHLLVDAAIFAVGWDLLRRAGT